MTRSDGRPGPPAGARTGSGPHRGAAMVLGGMVSLLALAVLTPFVLVDWPDNVAAPLNYGLALLIVTIAAVRISGTLGSGRPDLFRAFFYLFVFVFLGVSALAQIVSGAYPQDGRGYEDQTVTIGLSVVLVGIVGYEVGWFLQLRRPQPAPTAAALCRTTVDDSALTPSHHDTRCFPSRNSATLGT